MATVAIVSIARPAGADTVGRGSAVMVDSSDGVSVTSSSVGCGGGVVVQLAASAAAITRPIRTR